MNRKLREAAILLRGKGKTYSEIREKLGKTIPKSTIATWCRGVKLPVGYKGKIDDINLTNLTKARRLAWEANRLKRTRLVDRVDNANRALPRLLKNKQVAKLALSILYLAEGSKSLGRASLMFGNSDPDIVRLFMKLLRLSYIVDESKLRCTIQGRADQNFIQLEKFWSKTSNIPIIQFYKSRIDPRTIGKTSRKPDYKGVCRIDYFSAIVDLELKRIVQLINKDYLGPIV